MSNIRSILGTRVSEARHRAGMTQEALAEKTGYSVDFISLIERGVNAPTLDRLNDLANALGMEAWQLLRPHQIFSRSRK